MSDYTNACDAATVPRRRRTDSNEHQAQQMTNLRLSMMEQILERFDDERVELRDYFAAHAPVEPWPHYKPFLTARPSLGVAIGESGQRYTTASAADSAEGDCWAWSNHAAVQEWDDESRRQFTLQWPYFYADAMLKERAK